VTAGATQGVDDVLTAFRDTGSPVACVTGSDKAYAESGADVIAALRAAGATRVLLAGRPSADLADLVDDHVAAGDDVVEFLRRTRAHLLRARNSRHNEGGAGMSERRRANHGPDAGNLRGTSGEPA
jgi:methylmalonyl-CoA mutase